MHRFKTPKVALTSTLRCSGSHCPSFPCPNFHLGINSLCDIMTSGPHPLPNTVTFRPPNPPYAYCTEHKCQGCSLANPSEQKQHHSVLTTTTEKRISSQGFLFLSEAHQECFLNRNIPHRSGVVPPKITTATCLSCSYMALFWLRLMALSLCTHTSPLSPPSNLHTTLLLASEGALRYRNGVSER